MRLFPGETLKTGEDGLAPRRVYPLSRGPRGLLRPLPGGMSGPSAAGSFPFFPI